MVWWRGGGWRCWWCVGLEYSSEEKRTREGVGERQRSKRRRALKYSRVLGGCGGGDGPSALLGPINRCYWLQATDRAGPEGMDERGLMVSALPVPVPVFTRGGASCSSCLPPGPLPPISASQLLEGRAYWAGIIAPDTPVAPVHWGQPRFSPSPARRVCSMPIPSHPTPSRPASLPL